jgi:hypothetical protein
MKLQEKIEVLKNWEYFSDNLHAPVHEVKTDLHWLNELNAQFLQPLEAIVKTVTSTIPGLRKRICDLH